ncbi:unnamed protein product, partial [Discosporangium mesarthrocarpum]
LFVYEFPRNECLEGYTSDAVSTSGSVFGELQINRSTTSCLGLGVESNEVDPSSPRLVSAFNASRLLRKLSNSSGWTFEMWALFENSTNCPLCSHQIVSISKMDGSDVVDDCSAMSNLRFLYSGENGYISALLGANTLSPSCIESTAVFKV